MACARLTLWALSITLLLAFWPRVCFALGLWLCTKLDNIRPRQTAGQNEIQLAHSEMPASVSQDAHPIGQDTGIAHDAIDVSAALDHVLANHLHAAQNFHLVWSNSAAILRASSLVSNFAANRWPHGAGFWP
jgi:hypothetical protein